MLLIQQFVGVGSMIGCTSTIFINYYTVKEAPSQTADVRSSAALPIWLQWECAAICWTPGLTQAAGFLFLPI